MSQKFILFAEKTQRKQPAYEQQKPRRFNRKRSEHDKSFDSKRSKQQSVVSQYIPNPCNVTSLKISRIHDEASLFLEKINSSMILDPSPTPKPQRKSMYNRTATQRDRTRDENNFQLKTETLQAEIELKNHEIEVISAECNRYKLQLDEQKQKRRKGEFDRRNLLKQIQQLEKSLQRTTIQNKKLAKEKEFLLKQVEFLEKINYDDKTRCIQSFREKHMEQELSKLREAVRVKKNGREQELERELGQFRHEKESAEENFRSMKSLVAVLQGKIQRLGDELVLERKMSRERILNSQEYYDLKEKYKRFLDQYKEIRAQNWNLKCIVDEKQAELQLSDSDPEAN